ncbi:MAG: hypothetical protein PVH91_13205 [Pseudomonadales bacterium]|jgi:hypothetical protein
MSDLTYVPLLNSIAVNEAKGEILLKAWADKTRDAKLKSALNFVAIREGEHAKAFTKRLCELGYEVDEKSAYQVFSDFDSLVACACSDATDAEKVAMLTGGNGSGGEERDPFRGFFNDTSIDPETGALLGRYIAEERDSGRRLRAEYDRVCAGANGTAAGSEVAELAACVNELREDVAKLRKQMKKLA